MSTEGYCEETYSDEGISPAEAEDKDRRKQLKKAKNQKRRARNKLKKKLKKDKLFYKKAPKEDFYTWFV